MRIETIGQATLYLGDCIELQLQLGHIDALVADPPYGMSLGSISGGPAGRRRASAGLVDHFEIVGDDEPFDPSPWLKYPKVILFGANHYASRLPDARKWLCWDKRAGGTPDNQADLELAWTNLPGPERMHTQLWRGMVRAGEENVSTGTYRQHPTQKPVALMQRCLRECKLPRHAVVCDPYMGSGTTGVAAIRGGYRFIGIEIVPEFFEIACTRIEKEATKLQQQPTLAI